MKTTTIKMDEQEVTLATSAALPIIYREIFKSDLFKDMSVITQSAKDSGTVPYESIITIYQLVYAMAKHANGNIPPFIDWLSEFKTDTFLNNLNAIIGLWIDEQEQTSKEKKSADR